MRKTRSHVCKQVVASLMDEIADGSDSVQSVAAQQLR